MYASNAGKSGGEFYTPQEVSELLTKLATVGKKEINKVYDPTAGSGSLLLRQVYLHLRTTLTLHSSCTVFHGLHQTVLLPSFVSPAMYRSGAEQKIRKYLIDNNFIDCVIQLPSNLFFGTPIATCIMVMKRGKADSKTLFIDATNECIRVTKNNKLIPENIQRIVNTFTNRQEVAHFSHLATYDEIEGNDYNLSVSRYVEAEDTREKIDIQKLNAGIEEIVLREDELHEAIRTIIEEIEGDV